jgi:cell filamentation protein
VTWNDPYLYPGTRTLKNKFGLTDSAKLDRIERRLVVDRLRERVPRGDFDLAHLQAIHRHLFQDVYDWAGEIRTVEISKDGNQFQSRRFIGQGMADVHARLKAKDLLRDLAPPDFARQAADILADVNYVHPFREGNGRTQLQYLKQLSERAGHALDLTRLRPAAWMNPSRAAHVKDCGSMAAETLRAVAPI